MPLSLPVLPLLLPRAAAPPFAAAAEEEDDDDLVLEADLADAELAAAADRRGRWAAAVGMILH